jgi:nucleoside-diphosphate-sugar epimerase
MQDSPSSGNVLVTGATGFIGQHLVAALLRSRGAIFALARDAERVKELWPGEAVSARRGDLGDPNSLADACQGINRVFHLAGYAHAGGEQPKDIDCHLRITVEGTRALIAEAVRAGVKTFVFASTVKAMGEGGATCLDESSPASPSSAYGKAKLEAEKLVLEAGRTHGMHACVIRFPLVYGRGNKGNIPRMIAAIDRGRFPPLPVIQNKRSMIHVRDAVQALLLAGQRREASGRVYIATDGGVYSTREIYESIYAALRKPVPRWTIPVGVFKFGAWVGDMLGRITGKCFPLNDDVIDKLFGSAWYSCDKIKKELGYRPRYTLKTALPELAEEYRRNVIK